MKKKRKLLAQPLSRAEWARAYRKGLMMPDRLSKALLAWAARLKLGR